jgi:hypothetical protein
VALVGLELAHEPELLSGQPKLANLGSMF